MRYLFLHTVIALSLLWTSLVLGRIIHLNHNASSISRIPLAANRIECLDEPKERTTVDGCRQTLNFLKTLLNYSRIQFFSYRKLPKDPGPPPYTYVLGCFQRLICAFPALQTYLNSIIIRCLLKARRLISKPSTDFTSCKAIASSRSPRPAHRRRTIFHSSRSGILRWKSLNTVKIMAAMGDVLVSGSMPTTRCRYLHTKVFHRPRMWKQLDEVGPD